MTDFSKILNKAKELENNISEATAGPEAGEKRTNKKRLEENPFLI